MSKTTKGKEGETPKGYDRNEVMALVCSLMSEGQSLRRICDSVPDMPKHSTIMDWVREDSGLADQYTRARDNCSDYGFDTLQDLPSETVKKYLAEGWEPRDAIAMARVEVDKEKWRLSKMAPKKYGDKMELSGNADSPLTIQVVKFGDC
jgi:hypothetical protein